MKNRVKSNGGLRGRQERGVSECHAGVIIYIYTRTREVIIIYACIKAKITEILIVGR